MRFLEMSEQLERQAQAEGRLVYRVPPDGGPFQRASADWGPATPADADPRWRPVPDPQDGALTVDPDFSYPTTAGPLTWRLNYTSYAIPFTSSPWGANRQASFPLRMAAGLNTADVLHEDGTVRQYTDLGGHVYEVGQQQYRNGDTLVYDAVNGFDEIHGDTGYRYHFPAAGGLCSYRATPQGLRLTYNYDGSNRLSSVQEPAGRRVTLSYNADNRVQVIEDPGERGLILLTYVGSDLTEVWEPEGVFTRYRYSGGFLSSIEDPEGVITTYTYASGAVRTRDVAGSISTYSRDVGGDRVTYAYTNPLGYTWTHMSFTGAQNTPIGQIDPLGGRQTYAYTNDADMRFSPIAFTDELGRTVSFAYDGRGWLNGERDGLENWWTYTNDVYANRTKVQAPPGHAWTYDYGPDASLRQLRTVEDPMGRRTTFGYQSNGLPQSVEEMLGYRTTFGWSSLGLLATVMNARGVIRTYLYNSMGLRTTEIDPLGARWTWGYDLMGRLVSEQDPLGNVSTNVYDTRGLVKASVDPLGYRTSFLWNPDGTPLARIDALGYRWTSLYDVANELIASIDPLGYRTSFQYDPAGRLTLTVDSLGYRTTTVFDAAGQVQAIIDELGYRTSFTHDAAGRLVAVENARGYRTTAVYDPASRVVSVVNALGDKVDTLYDLSGLPTVRIDPLGYRTTLSYDLRALRQAIEDPLGFRTTFGYDATGRLIGVQNALGYRWTQVRDALDRVEAVVNPLAYRTSTIFDAASRPIALLDARDNRWSQSFDARDLPLATVDPLGRRATVGYDPVGQVVTWTNARGQVATHSYNARGEVVEERYADGSRVTTTYDAVGQPRTVVDATGRYTMSYNGRGEKVTDEAPQHPAVGILTHGYDAVGNRTLLHSWLGRQTMAYDAINRCTVMEDPDSRRTTWSFDARSLMTRQDNWNGTRTTAAYDARGLTSGIRHSTSANALLEENQYSWNAAGQPTKRTTSGGVTSWGYDAASQLISEWHELGLIATWAYDPAGNRLSQDRLQGGVRTLTGYAYDVASQIVTLTEGGTTTTFTFDANGSLRSEERITGARTTYSWDPKDRLLLLEVMGAAPATYSYRYDGLLGTANQGEGSLKQVWDVPGLTGYGDVLEEIEANDTLKRAYYRAQRLATQRDASGQALVAAQDHLGSIQLFTDGLQAVAGSYRWGAWGEALTASGTASGPLGWLGEWGYYRADSRRAWVRARHLDLSLGRWLTQDPLGFLGSANVYLYVRDDPLAELDPTGLYIDWKTPVGGKPVPGSFVLTIEAQLAAIRNSGPVGRYLISELESSPHPIRIRPLSWEPVSLGNPGVPATAEDSYAGIYAREGFHIGQLFGIHRTPRRGRGCGSTVYTDPSFTPPAGAILTAGPGKPGTPSVITLAHELAHALRLARGLIHIQYVSHLDPRYKEYQPTVRNPNPLPPHGNIQEELAAGQIENLIRSEFGFQKRTEYILRGQPYVIPPPDQPAVPRLLR